MNAPIETHGSLPSRIALLLVALSLAACDNSGPTPGSDAGRGSDAGPSADAGPGSDVDAASPPADAGPVTAAQMRCIELANNFRDRCEESNGPGDVRVCLWEGYMQLCRTGNTALLTEAIECLNATTCRTFSDANEGRECLMAITTRPPAADTAIENFCTECGGTMCDGSAGLAEIFPYLPESSLGELDSCLSADACSIEGGIDSCVATIPALSAFSCGR